MKRQPLFPQTSNPHSQRGIATILIVVLIGVALTATAMSIMHSMRSSQEKHIAVHAATNAQVGAWAGVEAFRRYLETRTPNEIAALPQTLQMSVGDNANPYGAMSVGGIAVTSQASSYRVAATITSKHESAHASASVGVVYEVEKIDPCPGCVKLTAALDFHDNLDVGGGISFVMPAGTLPTINVDGNVSMMNLAPMTLGILNSTGTINLDSNMRVEEINSNGNVSLTGDARAEKVTTQGTVVTGGNGGARIIWANGAVTLGGVYRSDAVNSRSTVNVNTGAHGDVKSIGTVTVGGSTTKVDEIQTKTNVTVNNGTEITRVIAEGDLSCGAGFSGWNNYTSISVNGSVTNSCAAARARANNVNDTTVVHGAANSVVAMEEVAPVVIPRMVVDVWTLKNFANYIFEWDSSVNRTKVTVKNINTAPDGEYWVGKYADNQQDYLCRTFDATGKCLTPAATLQGCIGHSEWDPCMTPVYNTTNKTWTFDGKSALPGVIWFKGNVNLNNGFNYGTILATGNVTTGGQMRIQSVNYAGFNPMCKAIPNADYTGDAIDKTRYINTFSDQYPKNLCDMVQQKYLPITVGNIAIAAGGYDPAGNGTYSGGDVILGANNGVYGAVLAGGYLQTGGETRIFGYVSAAVQGGKGVTDNRLGGSTTVDLTRGNENYDPAKMPDMTGGACPDCAGLTGPKTGASKVHWSKYL
jgi:hypothetical protein